MAQTDSFDPAFFAGNRQALRKRVTDDMPIVVTANGLLQRGADSGYAFTQDANFRYLTGINEPDITLVISGDDEFLIVPGREATRQTFDGAIDSEQLKRVSGIGKVVDETTGWKHLDFLLERSGQVAMPTPAPIYLQHHGMYSNPARLRVLERMQQHVADLKIVDIREHMARLRMIKQAPELRALREAIDITAATLNEVLADDALAAYRYEYEIEADVFRGFRKRGAAGHSFEPIVAGGKNACTLHNVANDAKLNTGELLVCDVGAEVAQYAADITRTVSLGAPTARQEAVYGAVQRTQDYALGLLKPGTLLKEYEAKVAKFMGKELVKLKLIKRADDEAVREFFPHATSHFLGLNVHDVGDYMQPLEAGMVLTCEPGIYIKDEAIGVRIEDDVLITDGGNTVLSAACRKGLG
jgi:Xaa-Pro aminopeptidase